MFWDPNRALTGFQRLVQTPESILIEGAESFCGCLDLVGREKKETVQWPPPNSNRYFADILIKLRSFEHCRPVFFAFVEIENIFWAFFQILRAK